MIAVLAGGVGAARLLQGLSLVRPPDDLAAVVNTGDDTVLHGLHISPDLDTVTYTLAGVDNPDTGWGLADETWQAMDALERLGGPTWFRLGDRDLGTHLYRTGRLADGAGLAEVTAAITDGFGIATRLLPMSDDRVSTRVTLADTGTEVGFQHYFVGLQHAVPISGVRFDGAEQARPGPGVVDALAAAETIVIAPSNPIVSIGPILAVPGIADTVRERRKDTVAVSPIIAGRALKGPADRMLAELGHEPSVVGVARLYRDLAATLVIDAAAADRAAAVEAEGVRCIVTATGMRTPALAASLADQTLAGAR